MFNTPIRVIFKKQRSFLSFSLRQQAKRAVSYQHNEELTVERLDGKQKGIVVCFLIHSSLSVFCFFLGFLIFTF